MKGVGNGFMTCVPRRTVYSMMTILLVNLVLHELAHCRCAVFLSTVLVLICAICLRLSGAMISQCLL